MWDAARRPHLLPSPRVAPPCPVAALGDVQPFSGSRLPPPASRPLRGSYPTSAANVLALWREFLPVWALARCWERSGNEGREIRTGGKNRTCNYTLVDKRRLKRNPTPVFG